MPFCANCGASNDEPVETCSNCAGSSVPSVPAAPLPAAGSSFGRFFAGALALAGGVMAGGFVSLILFLSVAAGGASVKVGSRTVGISLTIGISALGLLGIVLLARSSKRRDAFLQIFLVTTLVTALGAFATCSSLFWSYQKT